MKIYKVSYQLRKKRTDELVGVGDDLIQANNARQAEELCLYLYNGALNMKVMQVDYVGELKNQ